MKKEIRQAFEFDGNFYTLTAKCFDLMALSLYWLAGCLPVVTAGASFSALYAAVSRCPCGRTWAPSARSSGPPTAGT